MRPIKEEATEQLYSDTRNLLENFDPSRVQLYLSHGDGSEGGAQSAVYTIVREEHKMIGTMSCTIGVCHYDILINYYYAKHTNRRCKREGGQQQVHQTNISLVFLRPRTVCYLDNNLSRSKKVHRI